MVKNLTRMGELSHKAYGLVMSETRSPAVFHVPGTVNGVQPGKLMLDCGSNLDVVLEEFAERTNTAPLFTKESNSLSIS